MWWPPAQVAFTTLNRLDTPGLVVTVVCVTHAITPYSQLYTRANNSSYPNINMYYNTI